MNELIYGIIDKLIENDFKLFVAGHGLNNPQLVTVLKYLYKTEMEYDALEIGTWNGITASAMGLMVKHFNTGKKIYGIDSLVGMKDNGGYKTPIENYRYNIKKLDLENYCELIIGKSEEVEFDRPIGFLFIDGGHSYEQVKADIEKYVPKVVEGGYILLHDYDDTHPGSVRAIDEANLGGSDECHQLYIARKK